MQITRPTRLYPAIVLQGMAFAAATAGCGGKETVFIDPNEPPTFSWQQDAGATGGGGATRDAGGGGTRDAGTPTRDAGTTARDAGTTARDAGTTVRDAGHVHPLDAGADAAVDAGRAVIDAGWRPTK